MTTDDRLAGRSESEPPGDMGALHREVVEALQEIAATHRRQRDVQARTREVAATLASIQAGNIWRGLELARRARSRVRRLRRGVFHRLTPGARTRGVPEAVRRAPIGVNVAGYIGAESGLGEAVRSSIRTLQQARIPHVLNNISGVQRAADSTFTSFAEENPHPFNLVHLNADNMVDFQERRGRRYFRDRYTIGFWFWELSRFRREWIPAFRVADEVWAATRFARDAIRSLSPIPVVRMPLPVAAPEAAPLGRGHFGLPSDRFLFLFTFDVSSQMERKNPMAVVQAFRRASLPAGRATLVLKFTNGHFDREAVNRLSDAAEGADVVMFDGLMDRPELNALIRACDCYVSLHRAEGFGLTMAEAMALDKPVVATAYSGNMDFMTAESAALVGYRLVALDRDYGPYPRGFEWADPDVEEAARAMRRLVDHPDWGRELGRRGAEAVRSALGIETASERFRRRLESLAAGLTSVHDDE